MRKLILFIVVATCAVAIGCSRDAAVKSFLNEFESVTKEMTKKIDAGDIEGAKTVFDQNKESLKRGFDSFKNAREIQVSADTRKELEKSVMDNVKALSNAAQKAAISPGGDLSKTKAIQSLLKDFVGLFQM